MLRDATPKVSREEAEKQDVVEEEDELLSLVETPRSALQRLAEGDADVYSEYDQRRPAAPTPHTVPSKVPPNRALSYPQSEGLFDDGEIAMPAAKPPHSTPRTCCQGLSARFDWSFWVSILSVACWALAGNASRLALHNALLSVSFMSDYNMFGPNCVGSFAIGFFAGIVPEAHLPVTSRALTVGFCGAFTTLSTWVYDVADNGNAAPALEEVICGVTMPFVFCLWGRDLAARLCAMGHGCRRRSRLTSPPPEIFDEGDRSSRRCTYKKAACLGADIVFVIVSVMAAVGIPLAMYFDRKAEGSKNPVTTRDLYMVVLAPAGAVPRYLLGVFLNKHRALGEFPLGTFVANILGTVLLVVMENMMRRHPENDWYWLVANGIAGAFTTVSSLVNEAVQLYAKKKVVMAYFYVLLTCSVTIGIAAIGRRKTYKLTPS